MSLMKKRHFFKIVLISFLSVFFIPSNVTYSYKFRISEKIIHIITIAYMNGAVDALSLDIEDIKKFKKDDKLLESAIHSAASDYIKRVKMTTFKRFAAANHGQTDDGKINYVKTDYYR